MFHQLELPPSRLVFKICDAIRENFLSECLVLHTSRPQMAASNYDVMVGSRWNLPCDLSIP